MTTEITNTAAATEKKVFFDTSIKEELEIVQDYQSRGINVVGWERVITGSLVLFYLYIG